MKRRGLLIRNAEIDGAAGQDVWIADGRIGETSSGFQGAAEEIDAKGGALIPGLIDHHVHLLATAALVDTLRLDQVRTAEGLVAATIIEGRIAFSDLR